MVTTRTLEVVEIHVEPVSAIITDVPPRLSDETLDAALGRGFGRLMGFARRFGLAVLEHPRLIRSPRSHSLRPPLLALPVAFPARPVVPTPTIRFADLPGTPAWRFSHHGSCRALADTYARVVEWLVARGILATDADWERLAPVWEEYVCDPGSTLFEQVLTFIYVPRRGRQGATGGGIWAA